VQVTLSWTSWSSVEHECTRHVRTATARATARFARRAKAELERILVEFHQSLAFTMNVRWNAAPWWTC